jgi:hypothetical protein
MELSTFTRTLVDESEQAAATKHRPSSNTAVRPGLCITPSIQREIALDLDPSRRRCRS